MSDFGYRGSDPPPPRVARLSRRAALLALLLAAGAGPPAPGQEEETRNTAHLKVYPELDQLVTRAGGLVEAGRYAEALAIWEDALARHPNALVPLDRTRARGISEWVGERIAALPEEGRAAHRRRVDPPAQHLFETAARARDTGGLEKIAELYPLSSWADDALALAGALHLDAGENERAAADLERALDLASDAVTAARLGLALSRCGRREALEDLARRAARELPDAEVRVGGAAQALAAHLKALAERTREARRAAPALELPAWEMMGGAPAGWKLAEPGVELARLAWADTVGIPRFDADEDVGIRRGMALAPTVEFRPLFPAVSDGLLFVQNGIAVTAYNLFARQPDKLWQFRVPVPAGEVMFDNRVIYAVSVHDGRVYANLITAAGSAEDQLGYVRVKFPFPRRALFALDAASGKPLWRVGGRPRTDSLEENASFATPPTPHGRRLYAGAIKQKFATDPFEHYVLCLDPETGKILWSTFVASGGTEINLFGNSTRESLGSPVSVAGDTAYYVTNHGVAAAIDAATGRLRWTHRYPQIPVMPTRSVYVAKNRLEWIPSPPLVAHGVVAVTPADATFLFALDARTGELRWKRLRGRGGMDVRSIYGIRDHVLVLGGERLELLDIRSGEPTAPPSTDELLGTGRGVVAEDGFYVPCRDKLRKLAWDGTWDEAKARPWPGGPGEGGNLLVVEGAMILASQEAVQVYFDRKDQERAIREELRKDPDSAVALYRGAILFLQSGAPGEAALLLSRVVERTAGSARPEDERLQRAARKRLFAVSMEAGRGELAALRLDRAAERFRAAREAAPDLASEVEAWMCLGQAHLAGKEAARAVEEYQELLVRHGAQLAGGRPVFDLAREAIESVVRIHGREAYAAQEKAARASLERALRESTPDAFLAVFSAWPNSRAAEEALYRAAGAFARLGRGEEEVVALRRFLREYPGSGRSPDVHAALVRGLERKGHFAGAAALLRRMLRAFPEADVPEGEDRVKAKLFAERRLASDPYRKTAGEAPLPALWPPLRSRWTYTDGEYREGAPLAPAGRAPAAAAGLLLMNYGTGVKALDLAREGPAWHLKAPAGVRAAAFVDDALLVADDAGVQRVVLREGQVDWRHEAGGRVRGFMVSGGFAFFLAGDPRHEPGSVLTALDASRGSVAWTQPFEGVPSSRVFAAGEAVVFTTVSPNRIHLFEAETGKRLAADAPFAPGLSARVVHVQDDLLVLHAERRFLEGYDLPGGGLRWRVNLERYSTRAVEVGPAGLVLLGTQRVAGAEPAFIAVVQLRTGKISRLKEDLEISDPRFMLLEGERAFVVSKEPDRSIGVRSVRLSDLSFEWAVQAGEPEATLLPPASAKDHLVVRAFEGRPDGTYAYLAVLLDKGGKVVQNIKSDFRFERPPEAALANGGIVFSVDRRVDLYR
jgi:outer membrane protein assembly factor BamB